MKRMISLLLVVVLMATMTASPVFAIEEQGRMNISGSSSVYLTQERQEIPLTMVVGETLLLRLKVTASGTASSSLKCNISSIRKTGSNSAVLISDESYGNPAYCTLAALTVGVTVIEPGNIQYDTSSLSSIGEYRLTVTVPKYYVNVISDDFTIDFDTTGGSYVGAKDVKWNKTIGTLPTPTRDGYIFNGWYTEIAGGTEVVATDKYNFKSDTTLYARWIEDVKSVQLDSNGGQVDQTEIQVTYGEAYGALPQPTREGYEFAGWYTDPVSGTQITASSVYADTSIRTLYAHWTPNSYTLTLNAQGGTVSQNKLTVTYGQKIGSLPVPVREGYTFTGWYWDDLGYLTVGENTVYTYDNDNTLYAGWQQNSAAIEGIAFNVQALELNVGELFNLEVRMLPENAAIEKVEFTIADETIVGRADVSGGETEDGGVDAEDGGADFRAKKEGDPLPDVWGDGRNQCLIIEALKPGTTVVEARTVNSGFVATCVVTVKQEGEPVVPVTGISLNKSNITMETGMQETLVATVAPANATDQTVIWESSDTGVATVSNGKITAVSAGIATITAKTASGEYTAECTVTVTDLVVEQNAAQILLESKRIGTGNEFTVAVEIKNNPGFSYLEVTPQYDSALTLVKVENGDLISDFTKGKQYVWVADQDVTEDGLLMTFTFSTAENLEAGIYQVGFKVRTCANYDEEAVSFAVVPGNIEIIDFLYGDATGDGVVDGFDVIRLKKYLANYDYDTETSTVEIGLGADANGDGKIDGFDVIRLKKYLADYDYDTGESSVVLGPK